MVISLNFNDMLPSFWLFNFEAYVLTWSFVSDDSVYSFILLWNIQQKNV